MKKPLPPLPRTWLMRQTWAGVRPTYKDLAISGRNPAPGTKAYLRQMLLTSGWSVQSLEKKAMSSVYRRVVNVRDEGKTDLDTLVEREYRTIQSMGYSPSLSRCGDRKPQASVDALWRSYAINPWWMSASHGDRIVVLTAERKVWLESLSAKFIYDVWSSLGAPPEHRPPSVTRLNLLSLMSSESINSFCDLQGANTDLLVLHGGLLDDDQVYSNLGYLSAIRDQFSGLILFEFSAMNQKHMSRIDTASRRSGINTVFGVA